MILNRQSTLGLKSLKKHSGNNKNQIKLTFGNLFDLKSRNMKH